MTLQLGDTAPDFSAETTAGPVNFHEWAGDSWVVLFSHPADYTPVCTTELGRVASLQPEFAKRGVKTIALSVDPIEDHHGWVPDIEDTQGVKVTYPIIADPDKAVATAYGMMHPKADATSTVRSVFVIDPARKVRLTLTYPAATGRNFDEILRVIDGLQLTDAHKVATPVDWQRGDRVIIVPSLQDPAEIKQRFGDDVETVRPYLRFTSDPSGSKGA